MVKLLNNHRYTLLFLLGLLAVNLWLRWPATQTSGFHNEDAAGIAYSAQLLHQGGLPLIDTLELKAPGSFFLSALVWTVTPMSITSLQMMGVFWSMLALLGIYVGGRCLFGPKSGALSACLYVFLSPIVDSMDINYGAWMIVPYI